MEDVQDYDESYFYYKKFLSIPRAHLKIDSRDYFNVVTKINYFNNPEFVVYRNLGDLIQDVKKFVLSGDTSKLLNIRDKNNFFIQSWDQKGGKSNSINTNSFLTTMIRLGGRRKTEYNLQSILRRILVMIYLILNQADGIIFGNGILFLKELFILKIQKLIMAGLGSVYI